MIRIGTILFASDATDEAVSDAKSYLARMKLTREDCRLVKRDGQTLVIAEKDLRLEP